MAVRSFVLKLARCSAAAMTMTVSSCFYKTRDVFDPKDTFFVKVHNVTIH